MEHDITVLDTIVMPKSNAYSEGNTTLRVLVNNQDISRIKKFAKKLISLGSPEEHYTKSKELWDTSITTKDSKYKADLISLSYVHYVLSNSTSAFWN